MEKDLHAFSEKINRKGFVYTDKTIIVPQIGSDGNNIIGTDGKVKTMQRDVVETRDVVAVLAMDSNDDLLFVKQRRHAVDMENDIVELMAGRCEEGETDEEAANRELQEEMGYKAGSLEKIGTTFSSPGFVTEKVTIFFASELERSRLKGDDDESIEVVRISKENIDKFLDEQLEKGPFDQKTVLAINWFIVQEQRAELEKTKAELEEMKAKARTSDKTSAEKTKESFEKYARSRAGRAESEKTRTPGIE